MKGKIYMYIQPNSTVFILKDVPFDNTYEHTILFNDPAEQGRYMADNYRKYILDRYHYQRYNRDYIRVEKSADDLYDCNYLMFQNTTYGSKWFYAFIKSVNYLNDSVSEIQYEIDDIQTWHFDYELKECFVEREHSPLDSPEDCWVAEKIETGDYIDENYEEPLELQNTSIVVFATVDREYEPGGGVYIDGLFSGLYPIDFPNTPDGAQACADWIHELPILKKDAVLCATIMPSAFLNNFGEIVFDINPFLSGLKKLKNGQLVDVKNRKCYFYPYNFLYVSNNQGGCAEYKYELFKLFPQTDYKLHFSAWCDITPNPSVIMYPQNYANNVANNYEQKLTLSGFPQVAFNLDAFKLWLSQSASSIATTGLALAGSGVLPDMAIAGVNALSPITGSTIEGGNNSNSLVRAGVGLAVANVVANGLIATGRPPQARGSQQNASLLVSGMQTFSFYKKHIRPEYATIIDDYFSAYGYACHRIKIPNISARPTWNYVKTVGCEITGSMPVDSMKNIKSIYDKGITFWKKNTVVGDYSQNNDPVI